METQLSEKYITFPVALGVHEIMQQQPHNVITSHENICETTEKYNIHNGLTVAVTSNDGNDEIPEIQLAPQIPQETIKVITEKSNVDENTVVYPIYIKQEDQQQYISADDESMAVEALRQLGGMYPYFEDKKINCPKCTNSFTQTQFHKHQEFCIAEKLTCTTCHEIFEREIDLNNHMVCHQVDRPHACRTCGNLFRSKVNLQAHMSQVHQVGKSHKCTICSADFQRPSSLSNHMKIHTYIAGRAITSQSTTNIINQTSDTLKKWSDNTNNCESQSHLLSTCPTSSVGQTIQNYDVTQVQWSVPTYTFHNDHSNSTIIDHSEKMDGLQEFAVMPNGEVTQFEYTQQNEITNQSYDLDIVSFENSNELIKAEGIPYTLKETKSHSCHDKSGENFPQTLPLAIHEKICTSKLWTMPIECEFCDKQFQDSNHLASHQTTCAKKLMQTDIEQGTINNKWGKHSCSECGKKFSTKQKMFRHQWIHRKKTHSCEVCGSQFEKQIQLDAHRLSAHPGDSPFTCNECGKSFVSRQGLWEHGRTHAGSPAHFHCDTCSKTFSSRQGYLIHHRTHTGERPYGCKFCWKAFRDGGTLRKHERIHTGERPHVCPLCSRAFNQKVVLREHVRWVHAASKNESDISGPPYVCPLCSALNQDRDELCAHIVKHSDKMIADAKAKINNTPKIKKTNNKKVKIITTESNQKQEKLHNQNIKDNNLLEIDNEKKIFERHIINTKQGETLLLVTTNDKHSIISNSDEEKNNFDTYHCHKTDSLNLITIEKNNETTILLPTEQENIINAIANKNNDVNTLFIPNTDQIETVHLITPDEKENNTLHLITKQNESLISIHKNIHNIENLSSDIELIHNSSINTNNILTNGEISQNENSQQKIFNESIQLIHYQQNCNTDSHPNSNDINTDNNNDDNYNDNDDDNNNNDNNNNNNNDDDDDDDNDGQLICGICGDDFNDKTILMEHIKIHI